MANNGGHPSNIFLKDLVYKSQNGSDENRNIFYSQGRQHEWQIQTSKRNRLSTSSESASTQNVKIKKSKSNAVATEVSGTNSNSVNAESVIVNNDVINSEVTELNEIDDSESDVLGQQNPWALQYSARLWQQNSKNSSFIIKEAEKKVMKLADSTKLTLMCTFNGISNINPNDFVANCHRTIACSKYVNEDNQEVYFKSNMGNPDGYYRVTSANSSNVAVLHASNDYIYQKLIGAGQLEYISFNNVTKEQKTRGFLRIKSIHCPLLTFSVTGAEMENLDQICDALAVKYKSLGGHGTNVYTVQKKARYEYFRDGILECDEELSGEIQLTVQLPPHTDKQLPTGKISLSVPNKGLRDLYVYQFGSVKMCKICGKEGCFTNNNKRCVNRCRHCGCMLTRNHVENTCPQKNNETVADQSWLVLRMEEEKVRHDMPVIDLDADDAKIKEDMDSKAAGAWREMVHENQNNVMKKVYKDSFFGARSDANPFMNEKAREIAITASRKKRDRRRNAAVRRNGLSERVERTRVDLIEDIVQKINEGVDTEVAATEEETNMQADDEVDDVFNTATQSPPPPENNTDTVLDNSILSESITINDDDDDDDESSESDEEKLTQIPNTNKNADDSSADGGGGDS